MFTKPTIVLEATETKTINHPHCQVSTRLLGKQLIDHYVL